MTIIAQTWKRICSLPSTLFLVLGLKVIESFADFIASLNLTLYLSRELGYTDVEAGIIYGVLGVSTSITGILLGTTIDRLGVRRSLLIGASCSLASRLLLAATRSRGLACFALFGLSSVGEAFAIPVLSIAVRQLVKPESLSIAFSLFYMSMQIGAIVSGVVTDALTAAVGKHALVQLFWLTSATTALYVAIASRYFPRTPLVAHSTSSICGREALRTFGESTFRRLVFFSLLLTGSRTVWRHLDVSMPKFVLRTLGSHARYGDVYAINPAVVLLTVTAVQAATAHYDPYDMIVLGTLGAALSPLLLYIFEPSYATLGAFMVVLSLGEVLYSPRVYEFSLRLAPRGREGTYSALASAPLFLIRLVSGASSGILLARYCGSDDDDADTPSDATYIRHCQSLWLVVALGALTTPLGLMLARRCVYTSEVRRRVTGRDASGASDDDEVDGEEKEEEEDSSSNDDDDDDDDTSRTVVLLPLPTRATPILL